MRIQLDSHHVEARLRQRGSPDLMESDPQLLRIHGDAEISVVRVVIFLEQKPTDADRRIFLEIIDTDTVVGLNRRVSLATLNDAVDVVATVAANDEWNVELLAVEFNGPGVSLIVVRVTREKCMRVNPYL